MHYTIGIIGGGQLARMLTLAAYPFGFLCHIYSDSIDAPATQVSSRVTIAPYHDTNALEAFASSVDVITCEFENIPIRALEFLASLKQVHPSPQCLMICRNRFLEKSFIENAGFKPAPWWRLTSEDDLVLVPEQQGSIVKTVENGYDGKGQQRLKMTTPATLETAWCALGKVPCIVESLVPLHQELSVIIARHQNGTVHPFPVTDNHHQGGILRTSRAPAPISSTLQQQALKTATTLANTMNLIGLLAVEFFVTKDGALLVNEMAPRPHNSGHWTIEGLTTSQFTQLVRILGGLPFGTTDFMAPTVTMHNILGHDITLWEGMTQAPYTFVHLYGKDKVHEGRKMGHITVLEGLGN
jgi:5-(carboxyamino)imidazole ribonucleotide synthase